MTDDEYDALSQKQLASIKRDMRVSFEDATVRATHKVMAEFEQENNVTDRELMQQALNALEVMRPACFAETTLKAADTAITALRDRLAKPHIKVEGPLHVVCQCDKCKADETKKMHPEMRKMWEDYFDKCFREYDKPLRPWVGLTPEEVKEISFANRPYVVDMVIALEAKLKEKNT